MSDPLYPVGAFGTPTGEHMSWTAARARLAGTTRHHGADAPETRAARTELAYELLARRIVDQAPPLTSEQRDRLVLLLRVDDAS